MGHHSNLSIVFSQSCKLALEGLGSPPYVVERLNLLREGLVHHELEDVGLVVFFLNDESKFSLERNLQVVHKP